MRNLLTLSTKKYFIVFDRIRKNKNEQVFNINLFYVKSIRKNGLSFSFVKTPFFRGHVVFGLDFKNKIRPLNFNKIQNDGSMLPIDPNYLKKLIFASENEFIAFSDQATAEDMSPITQMLDSLQFDKNKIKKFSFCDSCLNDGKFTLLTDSNQIKSFNDKILCPECVLNIVLREAKFAGLISDEKISPKLKDFFNHMILKFKNIKKVLNAIQPDFNPVENRDLTIYDVEKPTSINKKYLEKKVDDLDVPRSFIDILRKSNIFTLLPIQALSIENGLLSKHVNQLIMAPTSGGKTLIGEIAGISHALKEKAKMLYLVPIVALANIRAEEFEKKYAPLKLNIIKKVGESLLDKREDSKLDDLLRADVIVATYEAIDFILRSGNREFLGKIGTIIIDEIQVLIDTERGYLLDGFISRLKSLYKNSQFLYLSATVGEPETLAKKLNSVLIWYNNRPVPIERHLILCLNETIKHNDILKLVKNAFSKTSIYGFRGQTIVFTNTRKNCENLTAYMNNRGIKMRAYHGGLTNDERTIIENEFQTQQIAGVITTAALAAGVDLPASQVIFESLAMGINWLTVAEFEQMLGRAGRLKKHELGLTYLLVQPGKIYSPKMKITEENIAIKLLNGKIKDFELIPDDNRSNTELLAFISMFEREISQEENLEFFNHLINNNYNLDSSLKNLISLKLIQDSEDGKYIITSLGRAFAKSFLTINESLEIIENVKHKKNSMIEIALSLKPLKNIYLSKSIVADLSKNVRMKYLSNNLFTSSVLSLMDANYVKKRKTFSREFVEFITKWTTEIFNCKCKDNPYCECGRLNLEKIILKLRIENKLSIEQIHEYLNENYKITVFKGDLIDYFENFIYSLESIKNIAEGIIGLDGTYKKEILEIPRIIESVRFV